MRKQLAVSIAIIVGALALGGVMAYAAGETTGTNVSCATATLPAHTVGVDGTGVDTISGTSTTNCNTATYTIPTSTATVTVTGSGSGTTTSSTSSAASNPCTTPPPGDTQTLGGTTYNVAGEDTFTKDAPVGSFAATDNTTPVYTGDHGLKWTEYPDGWPSTNSNGAIGYEPSTVQSVHDGMLDFYLHTNPQGHPVGANPSPLPGGNRYQTYGAYSFCEKIAPSDSHGLDDFKQAILLWPQNDSDGPNAESDFPEGNLNATSMGAFAHHNGTQDNFPTSTLDLSQWHVYTQTWGPGFRSYYVDGKLIGTSTSSVWAQPERWQLQVEPLAFNDGATGHVYVSWVWIGQAGSQSSSSSSTSTTSSTSQTTPTTSTTSSTSSTSTTTSTTTAAAGKIQHVVEIFMENQDYSNVYGPLSYETSTADKFGLATNYYATGHYSLDNYLTATSGVTGVGNNDSCGSWSNDNIFHQLGSGNAVDLEDSGAACRHEPAAQYSDLSSSFQQALPSSFTSSTFNPEFVFISPNDTDNGHSSSAATGDSWLSTEVPKIMATPQYQAGAMAIFLVYDESNVNDVQGNTTPPNNHVYVSVISPYTSGVKDSTQFTHCSLLRTVEDLFSQPALGCAANATSMVGHFGF